MKSRLAFNGMAVGAGGNRRPRRLSLRTSLALGQDHATSPLDWVGPDRVARLLARSLCVLSASLRIEIIRFGALPAVTEIARISCM
jgi:hypothetical protein